MTALWIQCSAIYYPSETLHHFVQRPPTSLDEHLRWSSHGSRPWNRNLSLMERAAVVASRGVFQSCRSPGAMNQNLKSGSVPCTMVTSRRAEIMQKGFLGHHEISVGHPSAFPTRGTSPSPQDPSSIAMKIPSFQAPHQHLSRVSEGNGPRHPGHLSATPDALKKTCF